MIQHIAVLIPARDEEDRVADCLRSILRARQQCPIATSVTLVVDGCLDDTARIARSFPGVKVVEIESSNVGAARRTAAYAALQRLRTPVDEVWLANTDADSLVPDNWLTQQIAHADAGVDLIIGTVRPDPREYPEDLQRQWEKTHIKGRPNGHVHGANLGIRASAYLAVGGYRPLPEHEDVDLVGRLTEYPRIATDEMEVITSARLVGRTIGGYAGYLRNAAARQSPDAAVPAPKT